MARVDNDTDDSDDGDRDVDGYDNGTHTSLDLVNDSLKINCNIKSSYTTWQPREAFRELLQNWSVFCFLFFSSSFSASLPRLTATNNTIGATVS